MLQLHRLPTFWSPRQKFQVAYNILPKKFGNLQLVYYYPMYTTALDIGGTITDCFLANFWAQKV